MEFLNSLNWAVVCVAIMAIINMIGGFKKGLVKAIIDCVSLIVMSGITVLLSAVSKNYTEKQYAQMITMIIMILVVSIGHRLIKAALGGIKLLAAVPVISIINKLAGAAFGLVQTLVIIWFALCLIGMFNLGTIGEYINMYIADSKMLTYLYENNLIVTLGEKILGPDFEIKAMDMILEQGKDIMKEFM